MAPYGIASNDSIIVDIMVCPWHDGGGVIPAFDPVTGALPSGDHPATLEEIGDRFGFTPRRRWLLKGLRAAVTAFWAAGIEDIFIDGALALDLQSVSLVDRETVQFLALTEYNGTELRNCPAYVREWVTRERAEIHAEWPDLPQA